MQSFLSDDAQKLSDAERRAEDARQRLAKAEAGVDHMILRAPIAGRVQSSVIANVGQVVASGQEIMRIVPHDSKLEIEAYVENRDIGFVTIGQEAVVKIKSFPFTRYGSIRARVMRIAKDAIPAPDASAIEGDPTHASNAAGFAGGQRTQNLVFAVILEPEASAIVVDGDEAAAELGHGGDGRTQDRRAAPAGVPVLAAGRGRLGRHARALKPNDLVRNSAGLRCRLPVIRVL